PASDAACRVLLLHDRNEGVAAGLWADHARDVAAAGEILGEDDVARPDAHDGAVANLDLGGTGQRDRVLAAWRAVPVEHVARGGHAKDDAGRRLHRARLSVRALDVDERL